MSMMPTIHDLKIWPEFFEAKIQGIKPWEHRSTVDRVFHVGDVVTFYEWDPALEDFTDRVMGPFHILYVLPLPLQHCVFTHSA